MPHLGPPATAIDEDGPPLTFQALAARTTTPATRPAPHTADNAVTRQDGGGSHATPGHLGDPLTAYDAVNTRVRAHTSSVTNVHGGNINPIRYHVVQRAPNGRERHSHRRNPMEAR